jgi:hypothetical protein
MTEEERMAYYDEKQKRRIQSEIDKLHAQLEHRKKQDK